MMEILTPKEPLDYEYQLLLIDMDVQNTVLLVFLQYKMLVQSFPRQCVPEWRQAWRRTVT